MASLMRAHDATQKYVLHAFHFSQIVQKREGARTHTRATEREQQKQSTLKKERLKVNLQIAEGDATHSTDFFIMTIIQELHLFAADH